MTAAAVATSQSRRSIDLTDHERRAEPRSAASWWSCDLWTPMKEILYIQAGAQANYVGTHFWNTQESYFSNAVGGVEDGELVEQDVSFVERQRDVSTTRKILMCLTLLRPLTLSTAIG
jgi:hypothetical protein